MTWDPKNLEIINGNIPVEPLKCKEVWPVFNKAVDILDKLGVDYWVASGTLLGLYRDGDFIPHDTDVDFECASPRVHHKIVAAFTKEGFQLCRVVNYEGKPMQRAFLGPDNIVVDIYFYHNGVNYNDHGKLVSPTNYLDPETYLEWRYGEDWITPKELKGEWDKDTRGLE